MLKQEIRRILDNLWQFRRCSFSALLLAGFGQPGIWPPPRTHQRLPFHSALSQKWRHSSDTCPG